MSPQTSVRTITTVSFPTFSTAHSVSTPRAFSFSSSTAPPTIFSFILQASTRLSVSSCIFRVIWKIKIIPYYLFPIYCLLSASNFTNGQTTIVPICIQICKMQHLHLHNVLMHSDLFRIFPKLHLVRWYLCANNSFLLLQLLAIFLPEMTYE